MIGDWLTNAVFRQIACFGNARNLEEGGLRRDMRIKAARGGGYQIGGDRRRRVLLLEFVHVALDAINQRFVGVPQIRGARLSGIVGSWERLGSIIRIGRSGRGWAAVKIFVEINHLNKKFGTNN